MALLALLALQVRFCWQLREVDGGGREAGGWLAGEGAASGCSECGRTGGEEADFAARIKGPSLGLLKRVCFFTATKEWLLRAGLMGLFCFGPCNNQRQKRSPSLLWFLCNTEQAGGVCHGKMWE